MKTKGHYVLAFVAVAMLALGATAWAKTYTLQATSIAPGATGTIDAKTAKAGENTEAVLKVDHLAKPTLLTPPANEYVVWLQPQGGEPQNVGVLRVGDNEKGDLKLTTSAAKFTLLVTVVQKTFDGTKSVAKAPVRITKDVAIEARGVGNSLVTHVGSAF